MARQRKIEAVASMKVAGGLAVNVFEPAPGEVTIWLDPAGDEKQGVCIGTGRTRQTAKLDAKASLRAALSMIEQSEVGADG